MKINKYIKIIFLLQQNKKLYNYYVNFYKNIKNKNFNINKKTFKLIENMIYLK